MELERVTIEGFRSIKNKIVLDLEKINAFIGANNSGKSNILLAIYKVIGYDWVTVNSFDEDDVYERNIENDVQIELSFKEPLIYEQYKGFPVNIPNICFTYTKYKIGAEKGQRRLEKKCLTKDGKAIYVFKSRPEKGKRSEMVPLSSIPQEIQQAINVIYIGANRSLKDQLPTSRNSLLGKLLENINVNFKRDTSIIEEHGEISYSRYELFTEYISKALKLLRTEEFVELEQKIKLNTLHQLGFEESVENDRIDIFFNPLDSLDFYKSLQILVKENEFRISATELGGGFQNAIVIAILKAFEEKRKKGAIFLIEEPELYLHPQMQRSLYKTIREIGKTNQVLYVTHSSNFVTIPEFNEIFIVSKDNNGTTIKKSKIADNAKLRQKFSKELDPERNELFFANKVLFVEGDTEKMAIPIYAKRKKIDIDSSNISIIEVGGKRNLHDFVEMTLSFGIKTAFAYDTDSSDFKNMKSEELVYNQTLNDLEKKGATIFVFSKNYEEEMQREFGQKEYVKICEAFPNVSKAMKAKCIADDSTIRIPSFINKVLEWLEI